MRTMEINKKTFYYAKFQNATPITKTDEWGNTLESGEFESNHTIPVRMKANTSPAKGDMSIELFGDSENYDKVIVFSGSSPICETDILWVDNLVNGKIPTVNGVDIAHDYIVEKVAESLNHTSIAIKKVDVNR